MVTFRVVHANKFVKILTVEVILLTQERSGIFVSNIHREQFRVNNPRYDVPLFIEQFAEDFIHPTLTPQEFTFYEDPYAWAGRGSDIRFVSLQPGRSTDPCLKHPKI